MAIKAPSKWQHRLTIYLPMMRPPTIDDYQYESVTDALVLDDDNRQFLEQSNPNALKEMANDYSKPNNEACGKIRATINSN